MHVAIKWYACVPTQVKAVFTMHWVNIGRVSVQCWVYNVMRPNYCCKRLKITNLPNNCNGKISIFNVSDILTESLRINSTAT